MDEILDSIEQTPQQAIYLKKSASLFKICVALILILILISVVVKPFVGRNYAAFSILLDFLVSLSFLVFLVLPPFGLFYSWKSYKRKESRTQARFMYTLGHLVFCLMAALCITIFVSDLLTLLT